MNASIADEFVQRDARHFAANRIVRRNDDGFGRIVHDQIHARQHFNRANVAALFADDAPFHFIARQRHQRDGAFHHLVRRNAFDGGGDNFARAALALFARVHFHFADDARGILSRILFHLLQEQLFRLVRTHRGDALNFQQFFVFEFVQPRFGAVHFFFAIFKFAIAVFDLLQPLVCGFTALSQLVFFSRQIRAFAFVIRFLFVTNDQRLVFGFQDNIFGLRVGFDQFLVKLRALFFQLDPFRRKDA
ncbi:MAG: hypothetical protein HDKAJFGB_03148 [Anaerolineae bacterium]|nr:hypothetical protein [Anaerolineae bacterium]